MTAYVSIADSEIDPESPGTTTLFTKLRDNPLSIAEGDASAPVNVGASLVLLETITASNSATVEFSIGINSTYDTYIIKLSGIIPVSNTQTLRMRGSTDGGSTFLTTSIYTFAINSTYSDATASVTDKQVNGSTINLIDDISFVTTGGVSGSLELYSPSSTALHKQIKISISGYESTADDFKTVEGMCSVSTTTAINALQFYFATGNISSGIFSLYGIKK